MRALSLSQPWASAVAFDLKSVETRSWRTGYTGPLAIHASAQPGSGAEADDALQTLRTLKPSLFSERDAPLFDLVRQLPLGAVVAVCTLYDCRPAESVRDSLSQPELALGDYSDGRWAWLLHEIVPVEPVPCRGALGLWTLPVEVVERVEQLAGTR